MMRKLCCIPGGTFQAFFGSIAKYRDDLEFFIENNTIHYTMTDRANSLMIDAIIAGETFDNSVITVDLKKLIKFNPKEDCILNIDDNKLILKDEIGKHSIALLSDPNVECGNPPSSISMAASIELSVESIERIFTIVKLLCSEDSTNNSIIFKVVDGNFIIHDLDNTEEIDDFIEKPIGENCRSRFDLVFVRDALDKRKSFNQFKLSIGTNMPCVLEMKSEKLNITIYIAPLIIDDID